jgi:tRNA C32,U32 (ribose-2'-O)-methylase TrmJ
MINKNNITNNNEFKKNEIDNYINIYNNIYILFIEPESLGNIGFIARTMANFGLKNLVLINPPKLEKEAYYYAVHAKNIVEYAKI